MPELSTFQLAVLLGAGVGLSTFVGSILAFLIKSISHKVNDAVLSFAAGIMLAATAFSLILPSLEAGGAGGVWLTIAGVMTGAVFISVIDKLVPHIHSAVGMSKSDKNAAYMQKVMLFVIAIAIHNFPEGIAVGVSFGSQNIKDALSIAIGISLQNIPEGLITIFPLLAAGVKKKNALAIALLTGLSELLGVLFGFGAVNVAAGLLPFALALAGGTMLYVISDEMIPETHSHGYEKIATFSLIIGFSVMLLIDRLL